MEGRTSSDMIEENIGCICVRGSTSVDMDHSFVGGCKCECWKMIWIRELIASNDELPSCEILSSCTPFL